MDSIYIIVWKPGTLIIGIICYLSVRIPYFSMNCVFTMIFDTFFFNFFYRVYLAIRFLLRWRGISIIEDLSEQTGNCVLPWSGIMAHTDPFWWKLQSFPCWLDLAIYSYTKQRTVQFLSVKNGSFWVRTFFYHRLLRFTTLCFNIIA